MEESNGEERGNTIPPNKTINFSPSQQQETIVDLTDQVHQLPCCIKFNGPSDVSHYFKPTSSGIQIDDGLEVKEAFFRGRNLQRVSLPLPQGYSGFVLGKRNSNEGKTKKTAGRGKGPVISDSSEASWEALAKSSNITFWNHDSLPSQDDASLRLFHFFTVAKALHEPLRTEDLT